MTEIQEVSSTEFAGKFGQWSFEAQKAPIKVTNKKTGLALGYFVSAHEFDDFMRVRGRLPKAYAAWELPPEFVAELEKPLPNRHPELDYLMEEED